MGTDLRNLHIQKENKLMKAVQLSGFTGVDSLKG
jgi:hypothetical protein